MYDVIIVGAGPAGSSTAYNCAKRGLKTILIDKRIKPGTPKQCAEGISKEILEELGIEVKPEWISNEIDSAVLSDGKNYIQTTSEDNEGYILDRKTFDYALVERAKKAGTKLLLGAAVTDISKDGVKLSNKKEIAGKIIIGADGPLSVIGKKSGLGNPKCGQGMQYEIKTQKNDFLTSIQAYVDPNLENNGWAWVFPKKDSLNVGIGSYDIKPLKKSLDKFVKILGLEKEKIIETNAGLIPLQGPLKEIQKDNILLVGDAAGHTNPLSGGGIPAAIFDGILVAEVIEKHLKKNYNLKNYSKLWKKSNYGKAMRISLKVQKAYLELLQKGSLNKHLKNVGIAKLDSTQAFLNLAFRSAKMIKHVRKFILFYRFYKYYKYAW